MSFSDQPWKTSLTNPNNLIHHESWDELEDLVSVIKANTNPNFKLGTHILGSFSRSFPMNNNPHLIPSINFLPRPMIEWDISNVSKRISVLGFEEIFIWNIFPSENNIDENVQFFEISNEWRFPCKISFIVLSIDQLFKTNFFHMTYFTRSNSQVLNNFLNFNGFYWSEVVSSFRNHGVILSGGTKTKRHLLTPNQLRLAQLLSCQEGAKLSANLTSFYLKDDKSLLALTPKESSQSKSVLKRDQLAVHEYDIEPYNFNPYNYIPDTQILDADKTRFNLDQNQDPNTAIALLLRSRILERERVANLKAFGIKKSNAELKELYNNLKQNSILKL